MKVEINHLTKVIQGNVVLDDINACFSCASAISTCASIRPKFNNGNRAVMVVLQGGR